MGLGDVGGGGLSFGVHVPMILLIPRTRLGRPYRAPRHFHPPHQIHVVNNGATMIINENRLSHWIAVGILSWAAYFVIFGVLIFHLLLGVSWFKVASFCACCCILQLAITPLIFSARATPEHPTGITSRRITAATLWITSTIILLLCYLQYGKTIDTYEFRQRLLIIAGASISFGIIAYVVGAVAYRRRIQINKK